jgi:hypothetical protein
MKIGLSYITQIRGGDDTGQLPDASLSPLAKVRGFIALTFGQLVASLTAGYHTEHNDDDTHKTIHASGAIFERGRTVPLGDWTPVPFAASTFSGGQSMTWTVTVAQQVGLLYARVGSGVRLSIWLDSTTLGGTASPTLRITLPDMLVVGHYAAGCFHYTNGGAGSIGYFTASPGDRFVTLWNSGGTNWTLASPVTIRGQIDLAVVTATATQDAPTDPIITYTGAASGSANLSALSQIAFTTVGTYTLTVNTGFTVTVKGVAGGGGGGNCNDMGAGGGGGGETTTGTVVALASGKTYTLAVGAKGVGAPTLGALANGTAGGTTSFVNTTDSVTYVSLVGGSGGKYGLTTGGVAGDGGGSGGAAGGTGGTGSNRVAGGTGGAGGDPTLVNGIPAPTAGGNATNGAGGGGGGGGTAQTGGAGGSGSAAGGSGGASAGGTGGNNGGLAGNGGVGTVGGGGGGGGGAQFTGVTGAFGGAGGGAARTGQAGGDGLPGVAVLVFLSKP